MNTDPVTGLATRDTFVRRLEATPEDDAPTVMIVSLDNFRSVNDSLGHDTGDDVLAEVGRRLTALVTSKDEVTRLGGDEFAVVLAESDEEGALQTAHHARRLVHSPLSVQERALRMSASIGIRLPQPTACAKTMLRDADTAAYVAKSQGAGRVEVFRSGMHDDVVRRWETMTDLSAALASDSGLVLHFQPVVDLHAGSFVGAEALVRWQHPVRGLVPPAEFIGIAEDTGLISDLGRWVLDHAGAQLATWQQMPGREQFRVHVNLSPVEFNHPGLVESVIDVIGKNHLHAENLLLEITETGLMTSGTDAVGKLAELKEIGVGLGIDDFGTGYSSISYLRRLPVDTVKLDRSLISGIASSPEEYGLTRAIFELMDSADLRVVAEGVETAVQVAHLRALGCRYGQGYYFARPAPAVDLTAALLTSAGSPA